MGLLFRTRESVEGLEIGELAELVECGGLENRCRRKTTGGSNPPLSVLILRQMKNFRIITIGFLIILAIGTVFAKAVADTNVIEPKVLVIIYNPMIEAESNKRLTEVFGWNNPKDLIAGYISDIDEASGGLVKYKVADTIEVDGYPVKKDGFSYTDKSFLSAWRSRSGFHQPDEVDYNAIIDKFNIISRVERGEIDEVWLFAFPYAGFYESTMAGQGAFFCNSGPVSGTESCSRRFVIMGFNYERGVDCMLEDLCHRAESIMSRLFQNSPQENLWGKFTVYDMIAPGQAACGNCHFAPNSTSDYEWGNTTYVNSSCDDWYNFPNFQGTSRQMNSKDWGGGDMRLHHKWWLKHLPKVSGETNGISNNWWEYIIDPNKAS